MMDSARHGIVVSLQLCPGYRKPMTPVEQAEAIENFGLKYDVHALPDSSRQVLLLEQETVSVLGLVPGETKENITTSGISLMRLHHRDRLQVGAVTILEITKACSPCSRMDEIRPGLLKVIAGKRGMLARVIRTGIIRRGDAIVQI